jgi:HEAT repeat protein
MAHVFISYKHDDEDFVFDSLKPKIVKEGFEIWIDEERLRAGEDWREEIDQAIRDSFAVVVLITPASIESQYVTYEWSFALGIGRKVIPLLFKAPQKVHPRLAGRQLLDFTKRRSRPWAKLFNRLNELQDTSIDDETVSERQTSSAPNDDQIVNRLMEQLGNANASIRAETIKKLGILHAIEVNRLVEILLADEKPVVRRAAAEVLEENQEENAARYLIAALRADNSPWVREAIADALGAIKSSDAIRALLAASREVDYDEYGQDICVGLRVACARALGNIGNVTAISRLTEMLTDQEAEIGGPRVCDVAADALRKIGTPEAIIIAEQWESEQDYPSSPEDLPF